jgi:hypothetical protein
MNNDTPKTNSIPPLDPSPSVRIAQQIREGITDLGGLALIAWLTKSAALTGTYALAGALVLLLPSPLLLRIARILAARTGASAGGAAAAAIAVGYAHLKSGAVLLTGAIAVSSCLAGCAHAHALSPIAPRLVEREGYGKCAETGGTIQVPRQGTVSLVTAVCWLPLDGGVAPQITGLSPVGEQVVPSSIEDASAE